MEFIVTTVVGTVPGVGRPRFIPSLQEHASG